MIKVEDVVKEYKTGKKVKFGFGWMYIDADIRLEDWRSQLEDLSDLLKFEYDVYEDINAEHAIVWMFRMNCIPLREKRKMLKKHPEFSGLISRADHEVIGFTIAPKDTAWRAFITASDKKYRAVLFAGGHGLQAKITLKRDGLGAIAQAVKELEENCGSVRLRNAIFNDFLTSSFSEGGEVKLCCWQ